jgi:Leucine-rich repeat (LRR) protein
MKLDYNDIEVLRSDDFEGLTELTILSISHNNLSYIEDNVFLQIKRFAVLDLSNNQLSDDSLEPNAFKGDGTIINLELSHNSFTRPPPELANRKDISQLHLVGNPMGPVLAKDAFLNYPKNMVFLDLSTCNLQRIEKGALDIDKFSYFQSLLVK